CGRVNAALPSPSPNRSPTAVVERVARAPAAPVFATPEELRARAAAHARRVELIPNGVDTRQFAPGASAVASDGERRILYVGRLSPEKNLETLITAAARLPKPRPRLGIVGAGPLAETVPGQGQAKGRQPDFPGGGGTPRL